MVSSDETDWAKQDIQHAPMVNDPLRQYMLCSPGEGAVALVLCRADLARRHTGRPIFLRAVATRTRRFGSFEMFSPWLSPERGPGPTEDAARAAFNQAGIAPDEVQVAQIQDTDGGCLAIGEPAVGFTHVQGAPGVSACTVLAR
jgi:acetyl-CoA acetyltransferase